MRPHQKCAAIFIVLAAGIMYVLALDGNKLGFYHDDGIYVVTAKSVAEGSGYRIASLPNEPSQTKYPPLYPMLLSIVWWINPHFPSNAALLLLPSIIATFLYLLLARRYLIEELSAGDSVAAWAVALAAFNPRTLLLASNAMSEAVFTLVSILALWASAAQLRKPSLRTGFASSILIAALVLTRASGISLLIALAVFALLRRRLLSASLALTVGMLVFLGWSYWVRIHAAPNASLTFYTSYLGDLKEIIELSGPSRFIALLAQNTFMLLPISIPIVCLGLGYSSILALSSDVFVPVIILLFLTFATIVLSFLRHVREGLHLVHIYICCYLLIHLLWPYSSYDRFLMPLLPFLSFFLVSGIVRLLAWLKLHFRRLLSKPLADAAIVLIVVALVALLAYGDAIAFWKEAVQSRESFAARAARDEELANWIQNNSQPSDIFLCYPDPRYYLLHGRKTIAVELLSHAKSDAESLIRQIVDTGSQYLIENETDDVARFRPDLRIRNLGTVLRDHHKLFVPVFSTRDATIYRIVANSSLYEN